MGGIARRTLTVSSAVCACVAVLCATAAGASALTIEVPAGGADSAVSCAAPPCPNLRSAVGLANANPDSTIVLAAGAYTLTLGEVQLKSSVQILGQGPSVTEVDQKGGGRVFEVAATGSPAVTLEAIEIREGALTKPSEGENAEGGGVASYSSGLLTLREVLVDDDIVEALDGPEAGEGGLGAGGGVYAVGPLTIERSAIREDLALGGAGGAGGATFEGGPGGSGDGGGVYARGALTVLESTISDNHALGGSGGVETLDGGFGGNGGTASGGGIAVATPQPASIVRSTVAGNNALGGVGGYSEALGSTGGTGVGGRGGGLELRNGVLENSTITGNRVETGTPGTGVAFSGEILPPKGGGASAIGTLTFASDTFAGNVAEPAYGSGGNIDAETGALLTLADTIVAAGVAHSAGNCTGAIADGGHNLEDTAPSQCGLSAASADVVGASPLLGALTANGGATQTMALSPGSPAIGAGGTCTDPAEGGLPLASDQRSLPRGAACDIGAFQHQPPSNVNLPAVEGMATIGAGLACSRGGWSGDPPLSFEYQWLRDGNPIAGASGPAYTVVPADAGHRLSCEVTARNPYATVAARSAAVSIPASPSLLPAPTLTAVSESHRTWREGARPASLASARRHTVPVGTMIRFTLNTPATITMAIVRSAPGRSVGGRCVAQSHRNRHARRCTRTIAAGSISFPAIAAGAHAIAFQGRLSPSHRLRPGSYRMLLAATDAAGVGRAPALPFTIVSR